MTCWICSSPNGARIFAIHVAGEPLRLQPVFCSAHGDAYLLRVGRVIGELLRDYSDPGQSGHTFSDELAALGTFRASFEAAFPPVQPLPDKSGRSRACTCVGSCKGAEGLAPGWVCALAKPDQGPTLTIRDVPACTNCGRVGHLAEDCAAGTMIVDGPGDPCDRCGRVPCTCP